MPDMDKLEKLMNMTPKEIEALAEQLAQNPQMAPPEFGPGGLAGVIDQMAQVATPQEMTQAPTVSSPLTQVGNPAEGPAPLAGNMNLSDLLAGGGQAAPQQAAPQGNPFAGMPAPAPIPAPRPAVRPAP